MAANGEFERTMDELHHTLTAIVSTFELTTSFQKSFLKVEEDLRIKEKVLDEAKAAHCTLVERFEVHEDYALQELEKQKKEFEKEKEELDIARKDWAATLGRRQTKADEDGKRICASEAKLQEREKVLAQEKKEFEQKIKEFETTQQKFEQKQTEMEKHQKEVAEKLKMAEKKGKDVNDRLADLKKREDELHSREKAVASLEKSIKETESDLKSRLADVEDRESMIKVTEADLQQKEEELEKARTWSKALVDKEMELQRRECLLKQKDDAFIQQSQQRQLLDIWKCENWDSLDSYLARMEDEESLAALQPTLTKIYQLAKIVGKNSPIYIKVSTGLILEIGASPDSEKLTTIAKGCGYNITEGITSLRVELFRTIRECHQAMNKSQMGSRAPSVASFHVS